MVELDVEHVLILLIIAFVMYHLSSYRCSNNGFRVGGQGGQGIQCDESSRMACIKEDNCNNKDLSNCDLQDHLFYETDFSNTDLTNAKLNRSTIQGVDTDFSNTNITNADFGGSNIVYVDLNKNIIGAFTAKCSEHTSFDHDIPSLSPYKCSNDGLWIKKTLK